MLPRKLSPTLLLAFVFPVIWALLGSGGFAGEPNGEPSKVSRKPPPIPDGVVEKTGVLSKERSKHWFRKWVRDEILVLHTPEGPYSLLRGWNKLVVQKLDELVGKRVTVTGLEVAPSQRHKRAGLKVFDFREAPVPASAGPLLDLAPPVQEESASPTREIASGPSQKN